MGLVKLYAAKDTLEAGHIRVWLAQHDLDATVLGEHLSAARGELPMTVDTLPAVWVDEKDAPQAMELMKEFLAQPPADSTLPAWLCPTCNENVEGQFDVCWQCGRDRPTNEASGEATDEPADQPSNDSSAV